MKTTPMALLVVTPEALQSIIQSVNGSGGDPLPKDPKTVRLSRGQKEALEIIEKHFPLSNAEVTARRGYDPNDPYKRESTRKMLCKLEKLGLIEFRRMKWYFKG